MIGDNMDNKVYDIAIIGGGPAGISTAIYAIRSGLDVVLINDKFMLGGTLLDTSSIENYPGFESIGGIELAMSMESHLDSYKYTKVHDRVSAVRHGIGAEPNIKYIALESGSDDILSKTVVIATGIRYKTMNVDGESEYTGKGISSCATCDGFFFSGEDVAVIGGGDSAIESAIELSDIANTVTVIHRRDKLRAEQFLVDRLNKKTNIKFLWDNDVAGFHGDNGLLEYLTTFDKAKNELNSIYVKGAFVNIGIVPNTEMFSQLGITNKEGFIENKNLKTMISGVYVVGDAREDSDRQVVNAVADGSSVVKIIKDYISGCKN